MVNKKLKIGIAGIMIFSLMNTASAFDPRGNTAPEDGDENTAIFNCFSQGTIEFGNFMSATLWADGFLESFQPWVDVFARNNCQSMDVLSLLRQRNSIRERIRHLYLTCKTENIDKLMKAYNEINAEIYYARHAVEAGAFYSAKGPTDGLISDYTLYSEMYNRYVLNGSFSEDDFQRLFREFMRKYAERKTQYLVGCETASWKQVQEKWEEFKEFFTEGPGIKDSWDKNMGGALESLEESGGDLLTKEGWANFALSKFQMNVGTDEGQTTSLRGGVDSDGEVVSTGTDTTNFFEDSGLTTFWGEIADFADEETYTKGINPAWGDIYEPDPSISIESLLDTIESKSRANETEKVIQTMAQRFDLLYREASDVTISEITAEIELMNQAIRNSFLPLQNMDDLCGEKILDKQC
jgi:hypothetical protein